MKRIDALLPYCPWPLDCGVKIEMWKHLTVMRELGQCRILSARRRPVGTGWSDMALAAVKSAGFDVRFREDASRLTAAQLAGLFYASFCKTLRLERAFGHANPYHRHAFPVSWSTQQLAGADLALINFSFWAHLPAPCPKVVVLFDLFSDVMWGGHRLETHELKSANLVVTTSIDEERRLHERGILNTLWSPPAIRPISPPLIPAVGIVGARNPLNSEGLRWLLKSRRRTVAPMKVFGGLGQDLTDDRVEWCGRHRDASEPYQQCGVILVPVALGSGVQVKLIEALAAGRAVIVRRGGARGLPAETKGWIEVDTADEMLDAANEMLVDPETLRRQAKVACGYYDAYLNNTMILDRLKDVYRRLL